jgi:hypothetical protein
MSMASISIVWNTFMPAQCMLKEHLHEGRAEVGNLKGVLASLLKVCLQLS